MLPAPDPRLPTHGPSRDRGHPIHDVLISGGAVFTGEELLLDGYVRAIDGVIAEVGPGSPDPATSGAQSAVLDAAGAIVMPGIINGHTHGLTTGPLFSSAATPLSASQASANADRHLAAGVTTAVNACGFAVPDDVIEHPLQILLSTTNLPHARAAAELVDGAGLNPARLAWTAAVALADKDRRAVAIGEVGSGATLGGGVAAYRYLPEAVAVATGTEVDPATATELMDALVGSTRTNPPDDEGLRRTMAANGLPADAFESIRAAILRYAVAPVRAALESFDDAARLSTSTGTPVIFHTAAPSLQRILTIARSGTGTLVAGHMNHTSMTVDRALDAARELASLGVVIDVSSLDIVHAQRLANPQIADALAADGLVDTLSTDYAGGEWEPMLSLVRRWVELGLVSLPDGLAMCTSTPARVLGLVDRGQLKPGLKADLAIVSAVALDDVRAVFIDGLQVK